MCVCVWLSTAMYIKCELTPRPPMDWNEAIYCQSHSKLLTQLFDFCSPYCNSVRLCVYVRNSVDVAPSNPLPPPLPPPPSYFALFTVKDLVAKQHPTTMHVCMYVCTCIMNFTLPVPRMNEMRFRQIGSRIMIMLKLMGSAGPRANARASCGGKIIAVN